MKRIKLKIILILLMLLQLPFSCKESDECADFLDVEPYYSMQNIVFSHIDLFYINEKTEEVMWDTIKQDYSSIVYPCDSIALFFYAPDTSVMFHSQHSIKPAFSLMPQAIACSPRRPGYAGTLDKVDKIFISSTYPFDETHPTAGYDLSDIVDIFAYSTNKTEGGWKSLREYNNLSPYEAPKRFHLLIRRKPTLSATQQFIIRYHLTKTNPSDPNETSKRFDIVTPKFRVK